MSIDSKYFSIDARTILQLGRDSIKEFSTALVELVKNCYDADASNVEIEIITKTGDGLIRISDDGFGMTEEIIDDNWLRIGFSEKKKKKYSQQKRRKTGEKGIGRIAADRLGRELVLLTSSKESTPQGLKVNWELFDVDNKSVSDIPINNLPNPNPKLPNDSKFGTEILITNLRHSWSDLDVEKLYIELSTLTSPFSNDENFKINLKTDINLKYKNINIESTFNDAAEIELSVEYDGKSKKITYYLENRRYKGEEFIQKIPIKRLIFGNTNSDVLRCGAFNIKLMFFLRDSSVMERSNYSKLSEFREVLDRNIGVKIYRDDIAVKPYGYADSEYGDWLGLAARKATNPAGLGREGYSITPNQLVGAVFIKRDENISVKDSSGREGLIETDEFNDLRNAVLGAIQVLESHRVEMNKREQGEIKEKNKSKTITKTPKSKKLELITNELVNASVLLKDVEIAVNKNEKVYGSLLKSQEIIINVGKDINETIVELLNERRTLNGLATLGITTAVFGHETESSISLLKQASSNAHAHLSFEDPDIIKSRKELIKVLKYSKQVGSWGEFALSRITKDKRTNPVSRRIQNIIRDVVDDVQPMIEGATIIIKKNIIDKVYSKVYPLDIEAILFNLITNAYQACLQVDHREIQVTLLHEKREGIKGYSMIVEDNGPGIAAEFLNRIWEPLFSTKIGSKRKKANGTGLGLTIVDSIVNELGGIAIAENSKRLNGAKFTIWLPKE